MSDYTSPMAGYTKLWSSLIQSTVWREDMHVKVVWITMLALSDQHGLVMSSVPGLADAARVSIGQCVEALDKLSSPDEWSRTKEHEGRRIEACDGGWLLLNHGKYRSMQDAEERREKVKLAVRRHRARISSGNVINVIDCNQSNHEKSQAEADTEAEAEAEKRKSKENTAPSGAGSEVKPSKPKQVKPGAVPATTVPLPEVLNTQRFREAWANWAADRKDRKKPITARAAALQMRKLAEMGEARAIAAIENSIANGYQGIFEPSVGNGRQAVATQIRVQANDADVKRRKEYVERFMAEKAEKQARESASAGKASQ